MNLVRPRFSVCPRFGEARSKLARVPRNGARSAPRAAANLLIRASAEWLPLAALLCAMTLGVTGARAQPSEDLTHGVSLELVHEGNGFWASGDYLSAADRYDRAYEIERAKVLQLWAARALERAGKWVEAYERYTMVTELPAEATSQDWDAARSARRDAARLEQQIPRLTVRVEGAVARDVVVRLNGEILSAAQIGVARYANPGLVRVTGAAADARRTAREEKAVLTPRANVVLTLKFRPARHLESMNGTSSGAPAGASISADTRRTLAYVSFGVSGAALLTGFTFAALALKDQADLKERCGGRHCPYELASDVDSFESKRTVSVATLIAGGVFAGGGLALYLTVPRSAAPAGQSNPRARASGHVDGRALWEVGWVGSGGYVRGSF
ncbi:MAG TPA: hypothetical protein VFQ61_14970 [Polyangiaceae bacterium]|nr:hypothetical protein [Polyangiaceae bacterium]